MLLMIDNYDSFTYNLVHYFELLGEKVHVVRHDAINIEEIKTLRPHYIVLSPGPGAPDDAGICLELIKRLGAFVPILGVCLGHQCIAQIFGGSIQHAKTIMHGKTSTIHHHGKGIFQALPNQFKITRYHSLVASIDDLPTCLEITAWTESASGDIDEVMGLKHKTFPIEGVQFHPEAILSEQGLNLLNNFLKHYD